MQTGMSAEADHVPESRQSAVCRRTISKNGENFGGDHVGDAGVELVDVQRRPDS